MASGYASQQPQGFKNRIERIAIVGAGGRSGSYMVEELKKTGIHEITAITRPDSNSVIPEGLKVKRVDYNDYNSLVQALQGQEVLIITMSPSAAYSAQDPRSKLIQAAADAKVPWILPNEYGYDDQDEERDRDNGLGVINRGYRDEIEKLGVSSWIGVACGFWYEFSLGGGPFRYGFDLPNRSVLFYDDGKTRIHTSTMPQMGRAVAALLALKVLPYDENDKAPHLAQFRNNWVRVSSFHVSQQEMFESILRVTQTSAADWSITHKPSKQVFEEGKELSQAGELRGFVQVLYSRIFYPDGNGTFQRGTHNTILDLPQEDLDYWTKDAFTTDTV